MNTTITQLATPPRPARRDVLEYAISGAKHRIDRDRGVIHDVKILGSHSRNGGVYPTATLAKAVPLYEGARVNIDHPQRAQPDQERTFGDWFGVMENVRHAGDGLYGDLSYLKSHPLASQICEAAERFPASFGLSHNAQVTEAERDGATFYDKIHHVRSIDIVCRPATTRGIFESEPAAQATSGRGPDDSPSNGASTPDWRQVVDQLAQIYSSPAAADSRTLQAIALIYETFSLATAQKDSRGKKKAGDADRASARDATSNSMEPIDDDSAASDLASEQPAAAPAAALESRALARTSSARHSASQVAGLASPRVDPRQERERRERQRACETLESLGVRPDEPRLKAWTSLETAKDRAILLAGWLDIPIAAGDSKPRCAAEDRLESGSAPSSRAAARWADSKLAALTLLGH